jgi:5-methylcytosine-specific restriction protein A
MPYLPKQDHRGKNRPQNAPQSGRRYTDKRYKTKRWQKLRLVMLGQSPICNHCQEAAANVLDHVVPVRHDPARFWDTTNMQTLCTRCHNVKSSTTDKLHNSLGDRVLRKKNDF